MIGITKVEAKEILDSRGNPTISVEILAGGDAKGIFDVPSGASTGAHEALELRDGDPARFNGKGVLKAVQNVNEIIAPALLNFDITDQAGIDKRLLELDGTPNKSKLGANAILGVSVACAKAAAALKNVPVYMHLRDLADVPPSRKVPYLFMNLINGGLHARSKLAFQEYLLVPQTESVEEALRIGAQVMHEVGRLIKEKYGPAFTNFGDEGGFAPDIADVKEPLNLLFTAAKNLGLQEKIKLSLDVAATSFFKDGKYNFGGKSLSADELLTFYHEICSEFPMLSIEDPFMEEAFGDFNKLNDGKVVIIGDDLTVTNPELLKKAIEIRSISGVIIKLNQIGTLTETIEAMKIARAANIECVVSHRSGETKDDFIADLAYAYGAFALKAGAPSKEERLIKYNRLLEIAKK